MEKIIITILFALTIINTHAQENKGSENRPEQSNERLNEGHSFRRALYIGASTGINIPAGYLGLDRDVTITRGAFLAIGIGSGTWGTKVYGEGNFYFPNTHKRVALGFGFSHSNGLVDETLSLRTLFPPLQMWS